MTEARLGRRLLEGGCTGGHRALGIDGRKLDASYAGDGTALGGQVIAFGGAAWLCDDVTRQHRRHEKTWMKLSDQAHIGPPRAVDGRTQLADASAKAVMVENSEAARIRTAVDDPSIGHSAA